MKKLLVVVNNRANYARIKTVLIEASKSKKIKLVIVVAASGTLDRYGDVVKMMHKDGLKVSYKINTIVEGQSLNTMAKSTALSILELSTIFDQCKPDIVFTIADRFETIATAITGSYMNIIVAHSQGGEVTGSIDESVRHSITKLAHLHFPSTKKSFDRLIRLGEEKKRIYLTGCPAMDLVYKTKKKITENFIKKYQGIGYKIDYKKPYLTVLQHPNTLEYGKGLEQIKKTLEAMDRIDIQIVWIWPNIDAGSNQISKGIRQFREKNINKNKKFCFVKNFTPEDYVKLLHNSSCVVGNSSSIIRECSALGTPGVCIGTRQLGRESGNNVLFSKYDSDEIYNKTLYQIKHGKYKPQKIFGEGTAGKKIVKVLENFDHSIVKKLTY